MKKLLRILGILVVLAGGFLIVLKTTTRLTPAPATPTVANPASVYCEQQSGTLAIVTDASGAQVAMCNLPDGTSCEEWAYMRGECPGTDSLSITGDQSTGDINESLTGADVDNENNLPAGSFDNPNGSYFGYIKNIVSENGKWHIIIDYVQIFTGENFEGALLADKFCKNEYGERESCDRLQCKERKQKNGSEENCPQYRYPNIYNQFLVNYNTGYYTIGFYDAKKEDMVPYYIKNTSTKERTFEVQENGKFISYNGSSACDESSIPGGIDRRSSQHWNFVNTFSQWKQKSFDVFRYDFREKAIIMITLKNNIVVAIPVILYSYGMPFCSG